MLRDNRKVDMRAEVKLPDEALAAEALVGNSGATEGNAALGQIVGRASPAMA
jgi:hypothetical protein